MVMWMQPVAWKEYCAEYWFKELQESMDRCTGCRDIPEILLQTGLDIIQSINTSHILCKKNKYMLLCIVRAAWGSKGVLTVMKMIYNQVVKWLCN